MYELCFWSHDKLASRPVALQIYITFTRGGQDGREAELSLNCFSPIYTCKSIHTHARARARTHTHTRPTGGTVTYYESHGSRVREGTLSGPKS